MIAAIKTKEKRNDDNCRVTLKFKKKKKMSRLDY